MEWPAIDQVRNLPWADHSGAACDAIGANNSQGKGNRAHAAL
jgi:hypothetical protein